MMIASRSLRIVSKLDLAAHHDRAAAGLVGAANAAAAQNDAAGREVRTGHDIDQIVDRQRRIVDQRDAGVDHFAEIMRRDVGRHADGDAAGAVDQQIWKPRRQDDRLFLVAVVIVLEIDGVLVDVVEQRHRRLVETALGVSHRRRRIAVDRAEIALPVDQAGAWRSPAPCAPARRRSPGRRAGDTYPSRRRRRATTSRISCRAYAPARASNRGCAGVRVSTRRAHRAARATRSRSSRNRDTSASSHR